MAVTDAAVNQMTRIPQSTSVSVRLSKLDCDVRLINENVCQSAADHAAAFHLDIIDLQVNIHRYILNSTCRRLPRTQDLMYNFSAMSMLSIGFSD